MMRIAMLFAIAGASTLGSCAMQMKLPEQFVVMHQSSQELRATTADDSILWVERFDLPTGGENLSFWAAALRNNLVDNRGYVLLNERAVKSTAGLDGAEMEFETTVEGATYRYLVTVFLEPSGLWSGPRACVARFTAEKASFAVQREAVQEAILTTRD